MRGGALESGRVIERDDARHRLAWLGVGLGLGIGVELGLGVVLVVLVLVLGLGWRLGLG